MAVSSKWNAIILRFLHCFKARMLPFSVRLHHGPQYFAFTSAIWKTQSKRALKTSSGWRQNASNLLLEFIMCSFF